MRGMLGLDQIVVELRVQLDGQGNVRNVVPGVAASRPTRAPARSTNRRAAR